MMKKLVVLVSILITASIADATIHSPMEILATGFDAANLTIETWGITFPEGMSSTVDTSGGYWALVGTSYNPVTGGYLTPDAPDGSSIKGDTAGLAIFGLELPYGIYGYFGSADEIWTATPGVFADGFTGYVDMGLYALDDTLSTATLVDTTVLSPVIVYAEADGPYKIGPGETIVLDGSGSSGGHAGVDWPADQISWYIDNIEVGQGELLPLSYDTLVYDIGLSLGLHQVKVAAIAGWAGPDSDWTTLEIVPEPASAVMLGLGAVLLVLRHKRQNRVN